jgi:hypothetical protein
MIGLISKKYSDKKHPEAHEQQLRKSLAEKVSQYEEPSGNPTDNFTELLIDDKKLRVAVEEITITGDLTGSFTKSSKDGRCLMPTENREFDLHTPPHHSSVEKSSRIDSAMKVSNQNSRDHEDDTDLDIDGLEDSVHREREVVDLLLKQGLQSQIDIVLEQGSHSEDSYDTEGDIDHEVEGIEGNERCAPVTFDSNCDYPSSQPKMTEVLFDDEFVVLNGEYRNHNTGIHLGETFQPRNVGTWGPRLVAKWCMQLAKQGNRRAQYRLGCMYALGFGVQQNYIMAYTWIKISALQHSPKVSLKLKEIESNLTTMHIDYARQLSRQYYEMYGEQ